MTVLEAIESRQSLALALDATDVELLLVDWVGELLYRFETDGFLVAAARPRVVEQAAGRWRVEAEVSGETRDPARHPIRVLVKAATFHGLRIERRADGYETLLVFDV